MQKFVEKSSARTNIFDISAGSNVPDANCSSSNMPSFTLTKSEGEPDDSTNRSTLQRIQLAVSNAYFLPEYLVSDEGPTSHAFEARQL